MRCDLVGGRSKWRMEGFNPHTYMRCDLEKLVLVGRPEVSIHTPTWGVTTRKGRIIHAIPVSIHTPTWGVTKIVIKCIECGKVSIHTPTWGVTIERRKRVGLRSVSIHTPTWGVTRIFGFPIRKNKFQSTHLHEVWHAARYVSSVFEMFQSTHLHEVWRWTPYRTWFPDCFNPHTYMRCDCPSPIGSVEWWVSIHTPTWGVTGSSVAFAPFRIVSIHTPTWGVTLCWITYYQPASLINYYANRYYFFDFTTQNCSINKLIYWFLTPAKLLFFL